MQLIRADISVDTFCLCSAAPNRWSSLCTPRWAQVIPWWKAPSSRCGSASPTPALQTGKSGMPGRFGMAWGSLDYLGCANICRGNKHKVSKKTPNKQPLLKRQRSGSTTLRQHANISWSQGRTEIELCLFFTQVLCGFTAGLKSPRHQRPRTTVRKKTRGKRQFLIQEKRRKAQVKLIIVGQEKLMKRWA